MRCKQFRLKLLFISPALYKRVVSETNKITNLYMFPCLHYDDVVMGATASQITSLAIVYSTVYSGADQRKHQSSVSLAFVRGIHRGPVNSPHKWPVTRKTFPFDDVIMIFPLRPYRCNHQSPLLTDMHTGVFESSQTTLYEISQNQKAMRSIRTRCHVQFGMNLRSAAVEP